MPPLCYVFISFTYVPLLHHMMLTAYTWACTLHYSPKGYSRSFYFIAASRILSIYFNNNHDKICCITLIALSTLPSLCFYVYSINWWRQYFLFFLFFVTSFFLITGMITTSRPSFIYQCRPFFLFRAFSNIFLGHLLTAPRDPGSHPDGGNL